MTKRELGMNCLNWLRDFRAKQKGNHIPREVQAIFIMATDDGAVCAANVSNEQIKRHLKEILRKLDERRIIDPYAN